jgi:ribosome-associated protein
MPDAPRVPPPDPGPPGGVELAPGVRIAESSLRFQTARSGGPGGQNVNKLNTKVELWVPVGALQGLTGAAASRLRIAAGRRLTQADEIHLTSEASRSQESNRATVMERLRELLIGATHEPKKRRKTKPSRGAKLRRLESKRKRGETKAHRRGGSAGDW